MNDSHIFLCFQQVTLYPLMSYKNQTNLQVKSTMDFQQKKDKYSMRVQNKILLNPYEIFQTPIWYWPEIGPRSVTVWCNCNIDFEHAVYDLISVQEEVSLFGLIRVTSTVYRMYYYRRNTIVFLFAAFQNAAIHFILSTSISQQLWIYVTPIVGTELDIKKGFLTSRAHVWEPFSINDNSELLIYACTILQIQFSAWNFSKAGPELKR